jgi:predicted dienelactone hydrolase
MKRWILGGTGAVLAAILALVVYALATGLRPARPVGFQVVGVPDPGHAPLAVALWYPTDAAARPMLLGMAVQYVARDAPVAGSRLPLVVISHGNGGGPGSHVDTALALAAAGFVVAAPVHTGDNHADQSAVGTARWLVDRSRHIPLVIDRLLAAWPGHAHIDAARIGVFGFSAGGFTALTTIGGTPDLARLAQHCARTPEFACRLWQAQDLPAATAFAHDARVKAAVVVAPGYGFAFVPDGLAAVGVPVQLWSGGKDVNVPTATNAQPVHAALGDKAELNVVPGAGHFAFLAPCGLIGPPALCRDETGFDRKAFHRAFDARVVAFFRARL